MSNSLNRRRWLRSLAASMSISALGASGGAPSGWLRQLAAGQSESPITQKNIILLWLNGGPATIDLWDLKPGHENGGPFQTCATRSPEIRFSEHLPQLAKCADQMAIVRSMTSKEGDHDRAVHLGRTGYVPQAGIDFPDLGALVAAEVGRDEGLLPSFVSIAPPQRGNFAGSGFLGPRFAPMNIAEFGNSPADLQVRNLHSPLIDLERRKRTKMVLGEMDRDFVQTHAGPVAQGYQAAQERAIRLMKPEAVAAFDLEREGEALRDRYGRNLFGQGCLLARRLVERGTSFVEVTLDGWDTHNDNFNRLQALSTQLDAAMASLVVDLRERGLLESTLVICQGEFGRTPKINVNAGRDHWPRGWSVALAGGGVGRGQVIGATTADGMAVDGDGYVVPDLIASVCTWLGTDYRKQNASNVNRPIRIADPDAKPIPGLV
ncbi:DUF1501 domain-containing protein [Blastopirellula retiformator]|uniref:DUF1501 domain-containing protein n=1 Tax=Blastopirellula retiformator TaxID=2527970 RepID=A0A5C5V6J2_9BACT|nr:DUF1501 domain-containing protein [Blastopirellula retiformator]TWT34178.1 hypothetical protein Enr8_15720 [Blastopirellula retiformator]